eukprot:scaffold25908_cov72-Phaeocystis_antarctica.AAC.5
MAASAAIVGGGRLRFGRGRVRSSRALRASASVSSVAGRSSSEAEHMHSSRVDVLCSRDCTLQDRERAGARADDRSFSLPEKWTSFF